MGGCRQEPHRSRGRGEEGSASLELIGVLPFLLLAILVAAQLGSPGHPSGRRAIAARAGARAALVGGARPAARRGPRCRPSLREGAKVGRLGRGVGRGAGAAAAPRPAAVRRHGEDEAGPRWVDQRGQATVELVAALPALLLAGYVAFQLLAAGYALTLADGAAEAGALALASGRPAAAGDPRCAARLGGGRRRGERRPAAGSRSACAPRRSPARSASASRSPAPPRRGRDEGLGDPCRREWARPRARWRWPPPSPAPGRSPTARPLLVELSDGQGAAAGAWSPRRRRGASRSGSPPTCRRRRWPPAAASVTWRCRPTGRGWSRAPAALALVRDSLGVVHPAAGPAAARRSGPAGSSPAPPCFAPTSVGTGPWRRSPSAT